MTNIGLILGHGIVNVIIFIKPYVVKLSRISCKSCLKNKKKSMDKDCMRKKTLLYSVGFQYLCSISLFDFWFGSFFT